MDSKEKKEILYILKYGDEMFCSNNPNIYKLTAEDIENAHHDYDAYDCEDDDDDDEDDGDYLLTIN